MAKGRPKMLLNEVIQNNPIGFILASALIGSLINALVQETFRHVRETNGISSKHESQ